MESILGISYNTITVIDSQVSVNGEHVLVALKCHFGKLSVGSILSSKQGQQWQVTDNDLKFHSKELQEKKREQEEASIFLYDLKGVGHSARPSIGQELIYEENFS
jgi:hypothetical protein